MRIKVRNRQQYVIGRGGYMFRPDEEVEVYIASPSRLREITACAYLDVTPVTNDADAEPPVGDALDDLTVAQLRERAAERGIDIPSRANRQQVLDALRAGIAAQAENAEGEGGDDDSSDGETGERPPFAEWETSALRDLAAEWELDVPADAGHDTLVILLETEHERRQLEDAPDVESAE